MKSLTVVVPAYNEEKTIGEITEGILWELRDCCQEYEVILFNDGSTDATGEIIKNLSKKHKRVRSYFSKERRGIACTLESLFELACMDYVLDIPGDGQVEPDVIRKIIPLIDSYDVVVCKRRKKFYGLYRWIVSVSYRQLPKILFGIDLYDPGCSKCMKREIRQRKNEISKGVFIEAERCIRAVHNSCRICKIDIDLSSKYSGNGTGAAWSLVVEAIFDMFKFWWYWHWRSRGKTVK